MIWAKSWGTTNTFSKRTQNVQKCLKNIIFMLYLDQTQPQNNI